ncbi:hypothetical protein OM318_19830, partial [Escherichia albertii]|nr:hypothetical protein [Escherichia albertii]MCZ9154756.1 hypothetical protein [Escherichia albertii]MCZ9164071.1 hypothetical protein [Escherichia albertii]MCZ9221441.1 hypothetical protein [Escherichia albertii]
QRDVIILAILTVPDRTALTVTWRSFFIHPAASGRKNIPTGINHVITVCYLSFSQPPGINWW